MCQYIYIAHLLSAISSHVFTTNCILLADPDRKFDIKSELIINGMVHLTLGMKLW